MCSLHNTYLSFVAERCFRLHHFAVPECPACFNQWKSCDYKRCDCNHRFWPCCRSCHQLDRRLASTTLWIARYGAELQCVAPAGSFYCRNRCSLVFGPARHELHLVFGIASLQSYQRSYIYHHSSQGRHDSGFFACFFKS